MENLRVLELYSGIGGMHFALKESGIPAHVVAAVDINTTANQVYKHNFPDTPLWNKTIEGIPLDDFNKLSFDMILMSPPCQPFTRYKHHVTQKTSICGSQQSFTFSCSSLKANVSFSIWEVSLTSSIQSSNVLHHCFHVSAKS
uniref:tRNA aspartic acid methyltransferase 1 n=1 Tax=Sphaeramia orbicularis TaxID=375764 RepID=A0A673AMV1_9TELE